ncbi:VIT1/CCC1 family predicted Fe2+/Mn2+ transporter [Streptacidiphilus sp. MAP12-16]|uniref:VIT1/CCC1 transporter family protein n=1 Tax=Streptacidiphilus sp. MAP12-16 TaxID=3156300 RepID=UPI003517E6BC
MAADTQWQDLYPDPSAEQESDWQRSLHVVPMGQNPVDPQEPAYWQQYADGPPAREQAAVPEEAAYPPPRDLGRAEARRRVLGARHRTLQHRDVSGGWLRPAVFGAMDGLVTNASLIAGVGGGGAANHTIVLTGLAGLIAGAFSMATGEYISVCSQNELTEAEVAVEQLQHWRNPQGEERELAQVFVTRGVEPEVAELVARQISADPRQAVKVHVREELGIDPDDLPSPWTAAGASFASFTVGALLPLMPYLFGIPAAFVLALLLAGVASFAGGAAVAQLTGRPPLQGGLRQFGLGALATGMTFLVGLLVGAHVS